MANDNLDEPTETIEGGAAQPRRMDPAFKRNLYVVGGVVAVCLTLVLAVAMSGGSKQQQLVADSQLTLGSGQVQRVESVTPDMAAKLERKQAEESEDARRRGQTYIPPDNVGEVQPVAMNAGPSNFAVGTAPVTTHGSGSTGESDLRRREGLQRQLEGLLRESGVNSAVRQRIQAESGPTGSPQQAAPRSTAVAGAAAALSPQPLRREVIGGLTIHAAELTSDIKIPSNASGFATGRITAGPAAGAFLTGTAKVVDEALEITFNQMRLNGRVYQVNARVLDETTAGAAIEGNVDRRLLQRYVFPVVLAAAQGFYTARAQTGSTVVVVGAGSTTGTGIEEPPPSTEQARAAGIAAGMQIAGQEVQKQAQAPIVVSRERGFPVGVLFNTAVTEEQ